MQWLEDAATRVHVVSDRRCIPTDTLLLATGQLSTFGAHVRFVLLRQTLDEATDVGVLRCLLDLFHGYLARSITVGDVFSDGRIEEDGLLTNETELTAPPLKIQRSDVVIIH